MRIYLVDNGSLRADSVLNLRRLASELSAATGEQIEAASLLHSSRVPADELGGEAAVNWERRLRLALQEGERHFVVVPLFFGPTGAIVDYMPQRLAFLREKFGPFIHERVPFIFTGEAREDELLLDILEERVKESLAAVQGRARVALVDHGSPLPAVTDVRNVLAERLAQRLGDHVDAVAPASMERREGEEYAFNEPLLEHLLRSNPWNVSEVVVAMLFLSPGRHAGPDGDVAQICSAAASDCPRLRTRMTRLIATHPKIIPLLARRWTLPRVAM